MAVIEWNILLIGSGAAEHALAWKITQSPFFRSLTALPGNDGIALLPMTRCVKGDVQDIDAVLKLAAEVKPDLVIIGDHAAQAAGMADALKQAGYAVAAAGKNAAQIETSCVFAKSFMMSNGIPTPDFNIVMTADEAAQKIAQWDIEGSGIALKPDVAPARRRIAVTRDRSLALKTAQDFMPADGSASDMMLLEQTATGRAVSVLALCDGTRSLPLGYFCPRPHVQQDIVADADGAYMPADIPDTARRFIDSYILGGTVDGMTASGTPLHGFLQVNLMIDGTEINTLSLKTGLHGIAAQLLMPMIEDDILPYLMAAATGGLKDLAPPRLKNGAAVYMAMMQDDQTAQPLPLQDEKLETDATSDVVIFTHSASRKGDAWQSGGHIVLGVTATGSDLGSACAKAAGTLGKISFAGARWRGDIGE